MEPLNLFEPLGSAFDQKLFEFTEGLFFDFEGASSDSAHPSGESSEENQPTGLPLVEASDEHSSSSFFEDASCPMNESSPEYFASDETSGSLQTDMSVSVQTNTKEHANAVSQEIQYEWSSSPPIQQQNVSTADARPAVRPATQGAQLPRATPSTPAPGRVAAMWRPLMGTSPSTASPPHPPRHQTSLTKVTKKKNKKTVANSRAKSAAGRNRTIVELYNSTFASLTYEERVRLIIPMLQGFDPVTGKKIDKESSLLLSPIFETIGATASTKHTPTASPGAEIPGSGVTTPNNKTGSATVSARCNDADHNTIGAVYQANSSNTRPSPPYKHTGSTTLGAHTDYTAADIGLASTGFTTTGVANNNKNTGFVTNNGPYANTVYAPTGQGYKNAAHTTMGNAYQNNGSASFAASFCPYTSNTDFDFNLDAIQAFNQGFNINNAPPLSRTVENHQNVSTINTSNASNIATHNVASQTPGRFNNSGIMANAVQMPASPSLYGCVRQQQALDRSAMLRASGRRR